jgi:MFS transporter, DHA2 family, multidrug resistance protein
VTSGPGGARAGRREWIGLAVLALPCLLYAMDLTVLNLAVPAINKSLRPSSAELLWIVDIYGFVLAGSLITMGALGDRIGRRRLLLTGAAAFAAASVLAAYATSPGMLIVARGLLGVAGATLAPSTLSLIRNMFQDPGQLIRQDDPAAQDGYASGCRADADPAVRPGADPVRGRH